ncbi:MAG: hypothetical protein A2233_04485 [Candidatus Kerfeldbacteria bacterium RIFOXYA2_FULL_38_24]|uniref:Fibronectin type-III domain-containing protein n=1 Tax=Candidatus Kerfeldbacteria bacterium RIFOXYB2_FULL_38_14 TaxID=1798547 RepID=A0A1G2BCB5_9BACT|nr:MAG: hypothetical protein A2233_04485 [Candidatus Kerfeldbacteria bacterium RIFOXYA2_FULL_38_24]OGY86356.1 MAG: hypothetical protein A2319_03085 [Candidatus Kerfeldbacteria bacterium RIFOXYB2_FULL_38_14]OGY89847.1 MAG: hypothetical protein A2458_04965 [Candidatus Kerfeldbacteria bacterium RIFOXYC2_FULL_38_9]
MRNKQTKYYLLLTMGICLSVFLATPVQAVNYGIPETIRLSNISFGIPEVVEIDQPEEPVTLEVVENKPDQLTLDWSTSNRSIFGLDEQESVAIEGYQVDILQKQSAELLDSVFTSDTEITIANLLPNTAYLVNVHAKVNGIFSDPATIIARTTPEAPYSLKSVTETHNVITDALTDEPISFVGADSGKYVKKLKWKKPQGKVRLYVVSVYDADGIELLQQKTVKRNKAIISGLKTGENYSYTVAAGFNEDNISPASYLKPFYFGKEEILQKKQK